jgi:chemotaxis protein methyltransferase CheR
MTGRDDMELVENRVAELLHRRIGLRPEENLRGRLRRCIRDDASARGQDLDAYLATLLADDHVLQGLFDRVTVQETAFFRHPEQFELLAREILPPISGPVTIWSTACANGQEAFSLAMVLEEHGIDGRVIATDLSTKALARTNAARYQRRELTGLSPQHTARHLTREGGYWRVNDNIRARVSTLQHNLLDAIPKQANSSQVIFCRNVLIYFSAEHARAFLNQLADGLPEATLFLGGAETIWQLSDRYDTVRSGDAFSYRRRADTTEPVRPRPRAVAPEVVVFPPTDVVIKRTVAARLSAPTVTRPPVSATAPVAARPPVGTPPSRPDHDVVAAAALARAGQLASAAGDVQAAVVAFRKCAYLAPGDPIAHLHLGLALESAGDPASARRAYAAARHVLTQTGSADVDDVAEGYTTAELVRFLDSKQVVPR